MSTTMTAPTQDLLPTRYSLLSRLQNWDDSDSWKDFFDTYWRLIYSIALKSGLTEAEAQDVVQETVISVAKNIHKFKRDRALGSFKGWLRNLTRWRIADQLKLRDRLATASNIIPLDALPDHDISEVPTTPDAEFEATWEEDWRKNAFIAASERVKRRVREEHYQIFDLNVLRNWPAGKVAKTLDVNIAQIYLIKHRIMSLIKKEIRALEKPW